METLAPIHFCPAAAIASEIGRLELLIEIAGKLTDLAARSADCAPLLRGLEAISEDLLMAAEEARGRLAEAEAVSSAGAIAQLLAALRDERAQDEDFRRRSGMLVAHAMRFASAAQVLDRATSQRLSQMRVAEMPERVALAAS
ncbi:MAG TPA: hypothetical protein VG942_14995 [Hyphomonadaceae bacterium]|nr:hypothetical protein [Hyphomonadaceae bacterium]